MIDTRQIFRNVSFNWIAMALGLVLGFIQAPIVVRGLGNTWYGIWVLVNQLTAYTWLFDLGIREAVVRYVSSNHARKAFHEINEIVSTAIYLYLLVSALTILTVLLAVWLLPHLFNVDAAVVPTARAALFLTGLTIAINWFFNAYVGILMGLQRFDIFQKINLGISLISFAAIVTLVKSGYGILALALVTLGGSLISNALVFLHCRKLLPELRLLRLTRDRMRFRALLNYGKYVLINNVSTKIIYGADAIIIGLFLPVGAITHFAIAANLINMMRNLVSSVTWILNPLFSELESNNDMDTLQSVLVKATKFSFLVGLPVCVVYLCMGKTFISLWMGEEYGEGSFAVLAVLAVASIMSLVHFVINSVLYGLSRHYIIAWLRLAEAALKIGLSVFFIHIWGIVGVALGSATAHILFMGLLLPLAMCKNLGISLSFYARTSIFPPIVSSIPFALSCYAVDHFLPPGNLAVFFLWVAGLMPVFLFSAWHIAFTRAERAAYGQKASTYVPALRRLVGGPVG